jgi:Amt family ammonium transporter
MISTSIRRAPRVLALLAGLAAPALARAQDAGLDPADSGDTAWILVAGVLGALLVIPGMALFHAGRMRAESRLSVLAQTGAILALVSVLWIVVGYTLAFGVAGSGWLGSGNAWMLIDLGNVRDGTLVPESAFALFEMAFALLAPALMVGAWADRARLGWVAGFAGLWGLIVYAPIAHWVWGGGWLASRLGTLDYAGGLVVHTTAGVGALVAALLMGRRERMAEALGSTGGSPALTFSGVALAWAGSLALAGGSAFTAGDDAAMALIDTHVGAASAALAWLLLDRLYLGKPTLTGLARGAVAGLAILAPVAGYVGPGTAILLGILGAVAARGTASVILRTLQIDDSLAIFATHGVTGMLGSVLLGLLLSPALGGVGFVQGMDLAHQLVAQIVAVGAVAGWSAIGTAIAALMVSMVIPMRVTRDDELAGLDAATLGDNA